MRALYFEIDNVWKKGRKQGDENRVNWEKMFPFLDEAGHVVSLVGGGGKTTLLYALSAYCAQKGWKVLTSTTTHIRRPQKKEFLVVGVDEKVENIRFSNERDWLWQQGKYVVAGAPAKQEKITILPDPILKEWIREADITFLEADGAKRLPCKFPAAHEPVILPHSDIVLAVAGLTAIYRPLGEVCFRSELAIEEWNREVASGRKEKRIQRETLLTPELLAWLLGSEKGARKGTEGRSFFAVLNQADTSGRWESGRMILDILERKYGIRGILTSFSEKERNRE